MDAFPVKVVASWVKAVVASSARAWIGPFWGCKKSECLSMQTMVWHCSIPRVVFGEQGYVQAEGRTTGMIPNKNKTKLSI